ncbi:kinase-like domain-containing protein [Mrakia frigida]|uniref:kinase-like domain-containing protein n=1 Tax=Mrakia frigida TaxID=29902 RepID=UPI003FCC1CA3
MSDTDSDTEDFQATQTATQPTGSQLPPSQEPAQDHWGLLLNITTPAKDKTSSQAQPSTDRVNYKLENGTSKYLLGRQKRAQIVFKELRISNNHCTITLDESNPKDPIIYLEDLGSSNGTWLNGEKLVKRRKKVLTHGDEIELGASSKHSGAAPSTGGVKLVFHKADKWADTEDRCEVFDFYHIVGSLGSGTFADVKKAITLEGGEIVAIKEIQKHKFLSNEKTLKLFEREIDILEKLEHPNICHFKEFFEDKRIIYLILEYVDGGNLLEYIMSKQEGGLSEDEAVSITRQICEAMAYTHRLGVTHRDLKPENVLLTSDEPRKVKIADFGLAKMCDNSGTYLKSMVGTPQYLAPEVVLHPAGVGYDDAVDSWSVGIIVYAMLTKLLPFTEESADPIEVRLKKRQMDRIDFGPFQEMGVSDIAKDFVDRLLSKDPKTRLSLEAALTHPWLRKPTIAGTHTSLAADDSFISSTSFENTTIGTRAGTEVAPEEPAPLWSMAVDEEAEGERKLNGLDANGSASMSGLSESESFSQPFSQLALGREQAAPPPLAPNALSSQFSLSQGESKPELGGLGSWSPGVGSGGRGMELDIKHSDGEGFNIPPPQPYILGVPPPPVYHPPIARPRAPPAAPSPAAVPPPTPPAHQSKPLPTPKRKRSTSPPLDQDPQHQQDQQERGDRDQTLLGSPGAAFSSSSLSDPPTSPKPDDVHPPTPIASTSHAANKDDEPSPVKRSARIRSRATAAAAAATGEASTSTRSRASKVATTPASANGRNVRRKTGSPEDSSVLGMSVDGGSPIVGKGKGRGPGDTTGRRRSGRRG